MSQLLLLLMPLPLQLPVPLPLLLLLLLLTIMARPSITEGMPSMMNSHCSKTDAAGSGTAVRHQIVKALLCT
jgi:hypothetical protein